MKQNLLLVFVMGASALLLGCASPRHNYVADSITFSEPPIVSISTEKIVDTMLRGGKYKEQDAPNLGEVPEVVRGHTLHPGVYRNVGEDSSGKFFRPSRAEGGGRVEKV